MKQLEAFKKDLKELLIKHEASLSIMLGEGSDTHGLYDEGIGVQFKEPLKEGNRFRGYTDDVYLVHSYGLDGSDL